MIFAPLNNDNVVASIADGIVHLIVVVTQMFHEDFIARSFRSVNSDEEQVVSGIASRDVEGVLLVQIGFLEAHAFAGDFGGIGFELRQEIGRAHV